jgi:hypothetical protein
MPTAQYNPPVPVSILRRPEIPLFALVFVAYAYFYQAGGWNQNSRFDLTRAIVERHTVAIDAYQENTGDKAERAGHWYCDKAPGLSFLAVPPYALVQALRPGAVVFGSYVATVAAVALPSALAVLALFSSARRWGASARGSAVVALAYALGTLAWPYSTLLHGHQLAAACGFAAFTLIAAARAPFLAGALLGASVAADYTAGLIVLAVLAYAAARLRWPRAALVIAGGLPPALALAAYHTVAFGHPLALPYDYVLQEHRHTGWFMGIAAPQPSVLRALLVGEYRGLFYSSPWLLAAVPGLVLLYRGGRRAEALTCGAVFGSYLLLNAGLVDWHGGWAVGPRYLVPALPFLASGAIGFARSWPKARGPRRGLAALAGLAITVSIAMMAIATAVRPEVPLTVQRPYPEYLWPLLARGRVARSNHAIDSEGGIGERAAWNLGHQMGLDGLATLAPLALWFAGTGLWLARNTVDDGRSGPKE